MLVEFEHFGYSDGKTYINPIYVKGLEPGRCGLDENPNRVHIDLIDGSWRVVAGTMEEVAAKLNAAMPKEGVTEAVAAAQRCVELKRQDD